MHKSDSDSVFITSKEIFFLIDRLNNRIYNSEYN